MTNINPRRFQLIRYEDESGVSGTGVVAVGVEFPSGYVQMEWLNTQNDRVQTEVVWVDSREDDSDGEDEE
jgi:hypothetical protein